MTYNPDFDFGAIYIYRDVYDYRATHKAWEFKGDLGIFIHSGSVFWPRFYHLYQIILKKMKRNLKKILDTKNKRDELNMINYIV